jgi:hypothetical protein
MRRLDGWLWAIVAAFVARFALVALLGATQIVPHNGWYWENKDQLEYYATGNALLHGAIAPIYTFMGYGTLIAPLLAGTEFVLQAIPRVAIVQLLLAVPAAWLLFLAGKRLLDRRSAALGTVLWLTLPIWLSPIWFRSYSPPFNMAPWWLGLQISVDYGTQLLAIAVLALAAGAQTDGSARRGVAIGLLSGLTVLAKPSNGVLVLCALVALAVWRRWRTAVAAALAAAVAACSQLVLDGRISGRPFHLEYWNAWPYGDTKPLSSITYIPRTFGKLFLLNYTGPLLMLAFIAALVVTWRRFPAARWLVVAQVALYALSFSVLFYSISEFMLRFMTTALPALCLACGGALVGRREGAPAAVARPLGRWAIAVGAVGVAACVALAVFTGFAPFRPVLPVLHSLQPTASPAARPGWVAISWPKPSAAAALVYRVNRYRTPSPTERGVSIWTGGKTTIHDHAGPGSWWYRVEIMPSAHPGGEPVGTHAFAVSSPGRVVVSR